jgi:hypothetical protein
MPEPAPNPIQSLKPFLRPLGYGLVLFGFLWLSASAFLLPIHILGTTTRFLSEEMPDKESFEPAEVDQEMLRLSQKIQNGVPSIFTPALLMFLGSRLLIYSPANRRDESA